jgi:1-acyl-sn-glycerol-3-phosphate acyltransferase
VEGTEELPRDGRFLLVGNHTQGGMEVFLISHFIRRAIGTRVRPLAERGMGNMRGPFGDLAAAYGAVVGTPENAQELMRHNETILVFPGGGREIAKFKGEEHTLNWQGRAGFARVAVANDYPIVPVGLVGSDDMYQSFFSRPSRLGQLSLVLSEKITGRKDMVMPLLHGIGPTLIPRPRRMYLRFGIPIDTTKPAGVFFSMDGTNTFVTAAANTQNTRIGIASARSSFATRGRFTRSACLVCVSTVAMFMLRSPCTRPRRPHEIPSAHRGRRR